MLTLACGRTVSLLMCATAYPLCSSSEPTTPTLPCPSVCESLNTACDSNDLGTLSLLSADLGGDLATFCSTEDGGSCWEPEADSSYLSQGTVPGGRCEALAAESVCSSVIDYEVYVPGKLWKRGVYYFLPTNVHSLTIYFVCSVLVWDVLHSSSSNGCSFLDFFFPYVCLSRHSQLPDPSRTGG